MNCQECQKRPASVHFTQVIHGAKKQVHLCDVCAKDKGYLTYSEDAYSLHDLLAGLFNFDTVSFGNQKQSLQQTEQLECPQCKLSFGEFNRRGKFGCAMCYETFSSKLDSIFRRVHSGNTKHIGKIPKRKGGNLHTKRQIESYQMEMQRLIKEEAFEEAAKVRDQIKALKASRDDGEAGDEQ